MTIDVPLTTKPIKINTNEVIFNKKEPELTAEYQGKLIPFYKDRNFEFTLDGGWINHDVWTSLTSTTPLQTISLKIMILL